MGAEGSRQQIGERIQTIRRKISENETKVDEKFKSLSAVSPETLANMVESIELALTSFSPFPESVLLLALQADPERIEPALSKCTKRVLSAPIVREQYEWFKKYLFGSTVWFKKTKSGKYLYEDMMSIAVGAQEKITQNMDSVYDHLQSHSKWAKIQSIANQTVISRQDDEAVGLLQDAGIRDIIEAKQTEGDESDSDNVDIEDLKNFIDNNLAVNILMTSAKRIDNEFQQEIKTILSRHGDFKPGPMKKVERAQSKMENDYMNEEYPKAAKLLDIVRCSVSYNTIDQLLNGYNAFIYYINRGMTSMQLARVKNGFLDAQDGGYRDIKVNVVYQSTVYPELKMICEIQFILNQYLYEKKRVHKLYAIAREQTYFDMVVHEGDELSQKQQLRELKFEPVLNLRDDIDLNRDSKYFFKSSIQSDLELLGMNGGSGIRPDTFFCIDIATKQLVFKHAAFGRYSHHWITINDQKYLSLQTAKNTINLFRVSDDRKFVKDQSMEIKLSVNDVINYCEYDESFEHIYIVRNQMRLEKRSVNNIGSISMIIKLETNIGDSGSKSLSLSKDGKFCVIGAGESNFFYIIDLETKEQFKLTTQNMKRQARSPCFINGDSKLVAVGGDLREGIEIWSVTEKEMVHYIEQSQSARAASMYSANGILAVGYSGPSKHLQLYDVSSWSAIYRYDFQLQPYSLYLSPDSKYLAAGGWNDEKCVVLKIV